jgi:ATP-binding cassette subfamily F protein uup
LQEVIADYDGTVLIVSHDRDFLDRTVTLTLGLDGSGRIDIIVGGYADWEAKRRQPNVSARKTASRTDGSIAAPPPKAAKLSYKDQRDFDLLPGRIEEIEKAIARDEATLGDADLYAKNPKRFAELSEAIEMARAEKDAAEERWLELAEMLEQLSTQT